MHQTFIVVINTVLLNSSKNAEYLHIRTLIDRQKMGRVVLTNSQKVAIYGWLQFRDSLEWDHVSSESHLTFEFLRQCGLTNAQLYSLQPNVEEWVRFGKVDKRCCLDMTAWPLHPVQHLNMDLADLLEQRWSPEEMLRVGVDVQTMFDIGMTADVMKTFGYSVLAWQKLGLRYSDVQKWQDVDIHRVFHVNRSTIASMLAKPMRTKNHTE
jgi:hypothetical protein